MFRIQKARLVWPLVKPAPFGTPYSFADIRSTHLDEGIAVMMPTPVFRVADEHWPVLLGNQYIYQLGPFITDALGVRHFFSFVKSNSIQLISD